jgi:hypothetical protein
LWRTHEIASAGSSAQSLSHASHGSGMQLNTDTWIAGDFLARPLRLRAAAGGGIAISGLSNREFETGFYVRAVGRCPFPVGQRCVLISLAPLDQWALICELPCDCAIDHGVY